MRGNAVASALAREADIIVAFGIGFDRPSRVRNLETFAGKSRYGLAMGAASRTIGGLAAAI